jgi:hypothetical protein
MTIEKLTLELILPEDTLNWFNIIKSQKSEATINIILEEKNNPPITEDLKDKKITSKGFKNITITDFPIRGRKVLLTFKRRYWQIEGQKELLKRNIKLCFPGTQLDKEFADFLKDKGRNEPDVAHEYSQYV